MGSGVSGTAAADMRGKTIQMKQSPYTSGQHSVKNAGPGGKEEHVRQIEAAQGSSKMLTDALHFEFSEAEEQPSKRSSPRQRRGSSSLMHQRTARANVAQDLLLPPNSRAILRRIQHGVDVSALTTAVEALSEPPPAATLPESTEAIDGTAEKDTCKPPVNDTNTAQMGEPPQCTTPPLPPVCAPGPFRVAPYGFRPSSSSTAVAHAVPSTTSASTMAPTLSTFTSQGAAAPTDSVGDEQCTPWKLEFLGVACTPKSTPTDEALSGSAPPRQMILSTTPRLFAPRLRDAGSVTPSADNNSLHASSRTREPSLTTGSPASTTSNKVEADAESNSQSGDSKLAFSDSFYDMYNRQATTDSALVACDNEAEQKETQPPSWLASPCASVASSETGEAATRDAADEPEEKNEELHLQSWPAWSSAAEQSAAPRTSSSSSSPGSFNVMQAQSPGSALSPAVTPQAPAAVAASGPQAPPELPPPYTAPRCDASTNTDPTDLLTPYLVEGDNVKYRKSRGDSRRHVLTRATPASSEEGGSTTSVAWLPEKRRANSALPQLSVVKRLLGRKALEVPRKNSMPVVRQRPQQLHKKNSLLQPEDATIKLSNQHQVEPNLPNDALPGWTSVPVLLVLGENQAQLAMLSSQHIKLD